MLDLGAQVFAWLATAWLHAACLFAAVWIAEHFGALRPPALRQVAWRAVILVPVASAALQVFVLQGSLTNRQMIPAPVVSAPPAAASTLAPAAVAAPQTPAPSVSALVATAPAVLGWAWLAWTGLAVGRIGLQRLRLHRRERRLEVISDPATVAIAEGLRGRAALPVVRLLGDPGLASPMATASGAVVLPGWTRTELSTAQRAAMLAHEVHHLRRRDPQWRAALTLVAMATLAPHGRLVLARLEDIAEHACDAWAARQSGGGAALAQCLAACAERGLRGRAPAWSLAMARSNGAVVERVRRLMQGREQGFEARPWRDAALIAGALGAAVVILPGFAIGHAPQAPAAPRLFRPTALATPGPSAASAVEATSVARKTRAASRPLRVARRAAAPSMAVWAGAAQAEVEAVPYTPAIPPLPAGAAPPPSPPPLMPLPATDTLPPMSPVPALPALPATPALAPTRPIPPPPPAPPA